MSELNLRAMVREVCDTSDYPDPAMIAKEVNRRLKKTERDAALELVLPVFVQNVIGQMRMGHSHAPPKSSRKVSSIREAWRRVLRDRINVGPEPGDWKFLGDCGADDLTYAAAIREEHARRNAARAEQYRRVAELLDEHGVPFVKDLPDHVLGPVLEDGEDG